MFISKIHMGICYVCGKETELPYKCTYCGLTFCSEHRLPEQHNCIKLPERNWDIFRELKNQREGYGWIRYTKNKRTPSPSSPSRLDPEIYEYSPISKHDRSKQVSSQSDMKCIKCGSEDSLYPCIYCNQLFCNKHILPENHDCPKYKHNKTPTSFSKIKTLFANLSIFKQKFKLKTAFITILNILFLLIVSLPVLDSIQLIWDSPLTFSRTVLPKWWDLFPSEYPIPSINLLYLYIGLLILFVYSLWTFISKMRYGKYDSRCLKLKYYYYVIMIGVVFLYFFSEANLFWANSMKKFIVSMFGRIQS